MVIFKTDWIKHIFVYFVPISRGFGSWQWCLICMLGEWGVSKGAGLMMGEVMRPGKHFNKCVGC